MLEVDFLLKTYEGRQFLFELLDLTGVFKQNDPSCLDFCEGQRSVGLKVLDKVFTEDMGWFTLMMNEFKERQDRERV
jgi:hypothetical protein